MDELKPENRNTYDRTVQPDGFFGGRRRTILRFHSPRCQRNMSQVHFCNGKRGDGIYISGHPLEADRSLIEKNIT